MVVSLVNTVNGLVGGVGAATGPQATTSTREQATTPPHSTGVLTPYRLLLAQQVTPGKLFNLQLASPKLKFTFDFNKKPRAAIVVS